MGEWEPVGDWNGFKIKDVFSPSCWTVDTGWSVLPGVRQGFTGEHHLRILLLYSSWFWSSWPQSLCSLMRECWQWEAARRPTFREMKYDMENMFQVIVMLILIICTILSRDDVCTLCDIDQDWLERRSQAGLCSFFWQTMFSSVGPSWIFHLMPWSILAATALQIFLPFKADCCTEMQLHNVQQRVKNMLQLLQLQPILCSIM